jgi:hypothetical protein
MHRNVPKACCTQTPPSSEAPRISCFSHLMPWRRCELIAAALLGSRMKALTLAWCFFRETARPLSLLRSGTY